LKKKESIAAGFRSTAMPAGYQSNLGNVYAVKESTDLSEEIMRLI
jgi:hypothetical protein